tara:strand:+ start:130 stop:504 length:375 start_codon:yes stop_codon:yes gene_type:complete
MIKLTQKEEIELTSFIKEWIKVHGYSQKELAKNLKINSSRTTEIIKKIKELHKKGGFFNVAKKLIEIEQIWISKSESNKNISVDNPINAEEINRKKLSGYSQLDLNYKVDIDLLMDRMEKDFKE